MSASATSNALVAEFASALSAASAAAGTQSYPAGTLYVIATPIGNLSDITLRALHVLQLADTIACEDTRHTARLLRAYGIDAASHRLLAVHQHNEAEAAQEVLRRLGNGQRIAYVSDAGTPAISDPGARLVAAVAQAGLRTSPLPGASSVVTALSAAGIEGAWRFIGFLPPRGQERQQALQDIAQMPDAVVLLEAPHRIADLAKALAPLGERQITLARELTKQFESIHTLPAQEAAAWLDASAERSKGEFVVIVHPAPTTQTKNHAISARDLHVLQLLLAELPTKSAVKLAAEITGTARNALYSQALILKSNNKL